VGVRTGLHVTITVSALAALAAVVMLLVVVVQMNDAHDMLERDGVLEFNFVHQTLHALGEFSLAAMSLRAASPGQHQAAMQELLLRYDVLYSIVTLPPNWASSVLDGEGAQPLFQRLREFTLALEARMTPEAAWTGQQLDGLSRTSLTLSGGVYEIGNEIFQRKAALRDALAGRMDVLIGLFWFFGALFLLAGLSLYLSMAHALANAARSAHEADTARHQLASALEALTDGDIARKARNRFLAAATHDLRQPLQAMQYYLAALVLHVPLPEGRELLERIGRTTHSAQTMLTGLLELSRLDAGVLVPHRSAVDADELLQRLVEEFAVEAGERSLTLARLGRAGWTRTDPQLLERVLRNLLANAFAYTERGGVTLGARRTERSTLLIEVRDTGIGIPERELETVFNEYQQAENALRNGAGLGLGLSIVRRLTRLLGTPLTVDSEPGRGTRFELTLPAIPAPAMPSDAPAGDEVDPSPLERLVVLVIDDDAGVREGIAMLLRQHGCQVECAFDIDEALARLVESELAPDLLLADYRLPNGRTGLEAIDVIRDELNDDVPALLVTGDTTPALLGEARKRRVPLLHKPIDARQLFREMDAAMRSRRADGASDGSGP